MITDNAITVDAALDLVWEVYSDVERWPTWTASVTRIEPLDGPALEVGHRFRITQPKLPVIVWTVTAVDPGHSWTWQATSLGATTIADHVLTPTAAAQTEVSQRLDQRGWLGLVFAAASRGLTRRYLTLEAEGLRRASEERAARPG